jgi:hypothetical protein
VRRREEKRKDGKWRRRIGRVGRGRLLFPVAVGAESRREEEEEKGRRQQGKEREERVYALGGCRGGRMLKWRCSSLVGWLLRWCCGMGKGEKGKEREREVEALLRQEGEHHEAASKSVLMLQRKSLCRAVTKAPWLLRCLMNSLQPEGEKRRVSPPRGTHVVCLKRKTAKGTERERERDD